MELHLDALRPALRPRSAWGWRTAALGGGLAAAAALALAVWAWPAPAPVPLELALDGAGGAQQLQPLPGLRLDVEGVGQLGGTSAHPELTWSHGTVRVDVEPGSVDGLTVHTREGSVHVLGTVFAVERDALGVGLTVERGAVELRCTAGGSQRVDAGGAARCLPSTAAGMLARARALEAGGAPLAEVQQALAAGLALEPGPALAGELLLRSAAVLSELGELDAAWDQVERARAEVEGPRRVELLQLGRDLALRRADCGAARALAEELVQATAVPIESQPLGACAPP